MRHLEHLIGSQRSERPTLFNPATLGTFNVKAFRAVGDGVADDTSAIQGTVAAALAAGGGRVIFPAANYKISDQILINGSDVHVEGDGAGATNIITNNGTAHIFNFDGAGAKRNASVRGMTLTSSVTRTAGSAVINQLWENLWVDEVEFLNQFNAIKVLASDATWISNNAILSLTASTGIGIQIDGNSVDVFVTGNKLKAASSGSQPAVGIDIPHANGIWLTRNDVIWSGVGLRVNPTSTNIVEHIFSTMNAFDSGTSNGVDLQPGASATIRRVYSVQDWIASNDGQGALLGGAGTINDVHFKGLRSYNNNGHGVWIGTGTSLSVESGSIAGNSRTAADTFDGIHVDAGVSGFKLLHNRVGNQGGFAGSQHFGINVDVGASDNYIIADNDLRGNTAGALSDGGTGANKVIRGNLPATSNLGDAATSRVTVAFSKTSDTTLADIPGLSADVLAGRTYCFEAILYTTSNVAGGVKFAIAGTATATAIIAEAIAVDSAALTEPVQTRAAALGTALVSTTAVTVAYVRITGTIVVNAAGTLTVQFAQNASNGAASTVLVGSVLDLRKVT